MKALLAGGATAAKRGKALVVGRIGVQALPKLASVKGVVSVGLVQFKQTGQPRGVADPLLNQRASTQQLRAGRKRQQADDVPYSDAPPLKGSNFEALKKLGVLDANTHKFAEAWKAGYAGEGTTVGVLDGGADFGHPDLIGTWKTCTNAEAFGGDPGWNGWPKAFDPFGTVQVLLAPSQVATSQESASPDCWASMRTAAFGRAPWPKAAGLVSARTSVSALMLQRRVCSSRTRSATIRRCWPSAAAQARRSSSGGHGFVRKRKSWPSLTARMAASTSA